MDEIKEFFIVLLVLAVLIFSIVTGTKNYNSKLHSDDIQLAEWVSPDGVHYWFYRAGYQAMMAPRYDSDGNLVIDKVVINEK